LCIAEDKDHRIWFGTDRGINIIDENNQLVSIFPKHKVQDLRINSILCDKNGDMWIGSENGLFVYDFKSGSLKRYGRTEDPSSLPGNNVNQVFEDKAGIIWVALWSDGLCRFDNKYQTFEQLPVLGKTNNPFTIFEDNQGVFWAGTFGDGLFRIEFPQGKSLPVYTQFLHTYNPYSVPENSIYSITQDNVSGNLWVLSQMGLSIISDRKMPVFERINALELFSDASNFLNHIMKDRQGNIWIATSNDGVYLANLNRPLFQSNTLDELKSKFGVVSVHSIFENDDKIWLSLFNFGIIVVDKKSQTIDKNTTLTNLFNEIIENQSNSINCFCRYKKDGSVWIGGNGVLVRVVKESNNYIYQNIFLNSPKLKQQNRRITSLFSDSKNRMWIGSRYGVFLFENDKTIEIISGLNNVIDFAEDKNGNIWIASPSKGVFRLTEKEAGKFISKQFNLSKGNINSDEINAIVVDMNGNIWAGTNNGGLNRYDEVSQKFISQNKVFSILDEDIKNIIVENKNYIWLATNNKVLKIDLVNKSSILFSTNDNIKISSFKAGAKLSDSEGKIYFGGGNGFCSFNPNLKRLKQSVNKVVITDIEIYNQSIFNNLQPNVYNPDKQTLHLNYKQRNVGFEFSALNYSSPGNIYYAYKLTGVDKDWVQVDSKRRYVNYNSLGKGTYIFQVKTTDENGVWIEEPISLTIKVEPAPYETWWAYTLYFVILVLVLYFIYRNVSNRIVLKRDILISRIEKQKSEELTQIKLRYFTNVSHELLTPLTIISCLIEDFNSNFPNQFKQYSIMKSNVSRLKRLLQQILDFRKVESGNMKLGVKQADLVAFINNICWNNFEPLAKEKKIKFSITAPEKLIAWFDEDKMDKILFNILSNAFKHTPPKGIINVVIQTELRHDINFVKLFISDTGKGISQDRIPFIFERFFGDEIGIESNGIGLSLTKELVELHKGTITVESETNKGTTFVVEIPIDSQKYTANEREGGVAETQLFPIKVLEGAEPFVLVGEANAPNQDIVVLIVEDNADLLMVLANSLSRLYKVLKASNGVEALDVMKDNDVDLIISDVMMPEMDGLTLCRTIKEAIDYSHTPVLLLTAKNQIADRIESYNAGADAYISKPFEMEVLVARINSLILNRQKRNKEYQSSLNIHPKESENESMDGIFLRQAIAVVEENLANFDFTHEQLIDAMNTSKSTLYRKIKSLTGLSPSEFVRNIRLKHACIMLKNETGNVSDIAYAVGFNDPKYFSTCFKAEFGVTPREYNKLKTE
jgi:signal transduction histidine kinase/ligand-binding sensor domain-containing protein/DNA-binding response OmpR family regulator